MTRVAVVGAGMMGRNHVRVYSEIPDAELVGIADQNTGIVQPLSQTYHVPLYSEMVEEQRPTGRSIKLL